MITRRFRVGAVAVSMALTATMWLGAGVAAADTVPFSGSASADVPQSPAGDIGFTLTVNGQDHDFSNVDNSLGGRLTLSWAGSQEEPRAMIRSCPGSAPGQQILLDGASPSATLSATWVSPTSQETIGPVQVPSREGFAVASVCVADQPDGSGISGDPPGEEEDPAPETPPEDDDDVEPPDDAEDEEADGDDEDEDSDHSHGSGHGSDHGRDDKNKEEKDKDEKDKHKDEKDKHED